MRAQGKTLVAMDMHPRIQTHVDVDVQVILLLARIKMAVREVVRHFSLMSRSKVLPTRAFAQGPGTVSEAVLWGKEI